MGVFFAISSLSLNAQSDTVYTKQGDRIIGKIKLLTQGLLTVDAESGDSDFIIKWENITKIKSKSEFRIYNTDGDFYIGYISQKSGSTRLFSRSDTVNLNYNDIIGIERLEKDFLDKLTLGVNLGYSYTKANETEQFTIRTYAAYKEDQWTIDGDFNAYLSVVDTLQSARRDATVNYRYYFKHNWFMASSLDFLNSDQQQLTLRTTGLLGIGSNLLSKQNSSFLIITGLAFNEEIYDEEIGERNLSYEGFLSLEYDLYGSGDLGIRTNGIIFPSFTEKGRYRLQYKLDLKWDLLKDFDLALGYSINYDNKPPDGTNDTDYVVSLTFGWEL